MKPRSKPFGKRDGKSSLSPSAVLGLLLAVFGGAAVLMAWKPWERTASFSSPNDASFTGAAPANPASASAHKMPAAIPPTNAAPATNDVITLMNDGNELMYRGDLDGAIQKYRAAMKINPEDEEIHFNLAFAFARQGRTNDAIQSYTEALRIFPDYAEAHNNLGNLLVGLRRHTEALEHFSAALKVNSESSATLNSLGRCLAELGKPKEAVAQFSEALRVNPDLLEARFNLATAYSTLGNYDEAIRQFEQVLKMEPRFVPAKQGIERAKAKQAAARQP